MSILSPAIPAVPGPPAKPLSAGTAFLLGALLPGAGHLYCGKRKAAAYAFGSWAVGVAVTFLLSDSEQAVGLGFSVAFAVYCFGFLDSYFQAREINSGLDAIMDENPRLAAILNLLTAGFGYFYVGERTKGLIVFVFGRFLARLPGPWAILALAIQIVLAWDAYRIARAELTRRLDTLLPGQEIRPESTRLHPAIPIAYACLLLFLLIALALIGTLFADELA